MPKKTWEPEAVERLCALYAAGMTLADISREMGIGKNTVIGQAYRLRQKGRLPQPEPKPKRVAAPVEKKKIGPREIRHFLPPRIARDCDLDVVAIPETARVSLSDLGPRSCRYPIGDPSSDAFGFCGADTPSIGLPYCAGHMMLCYRPAPKQRARAWRIRAA